MTFKTHRFNAKAAIRAAVLAGALAPLAAPVPSAFGQETATPSPQATPGQVEPGSGAQEPKPENGLNIHGLVGSDFTTHYISRGLDLEDQGFIAQPYMELDITLAENKDATFSKTIGFVGIWNSLNSNHTDAGLAIADPTTGDRPPVTTDLWYEFDWYAGVAFDISDFNLNLSYWEFTSPNQGFGRSKNLQAKLSYNDTKLWNHGKDSGFALKPYGIVFIETDGKAGSGSDEGVYVELGIEPTIYTLAKDGKYPVALSVPAKIGLGFSDFYEDDETLGFISVGLKASVPLSFIPARYGSWSANAGVYYYYYGPGVDDFNKLAGDGNDDIVASAGFSFTF